MKIFGRSNGEMHNFWQNYTDLMSGLMIIFLVASVGYVVSQDDSRKIKAIVNAQKELADRSKFFTYNEKYNRFECTIDVKFPAYSLVHDIDKASQIHANNRKDLINAGKELRSFIDQQRAKYDGIDFEILIDGRAAGSFQKGTLVPQLSFRRAHSLYELWKQNGLFDNTKDNIHPAGSGYGGVGRYSATDDRNRTFIISIIPFIKK
jgi:hypothetical protein